MKEAWAGFFKEVRKKVIKRKKETKGLCAIITVTVRVF